MGVPGLLACAFPGASSYALRRALSFRRLSFANRRAAPIGQRRQRRRPAGPKTMLCMRLHSSVLYCSLHKLHLARAVRARRPSFRRTGSFTPLDCPDRSRAPLPARTIDVAGLGHLHGALRMASRRFSITVVGRARGLDARLDLPQDLASGPPGAGCRW